MFYDHSATSLNVSWTPGDTNPVGLNFSVRLVGNISLHINTTATFHVFKNLTSGTMYNASVFAYQQESEENKTRLQSDPTSNSTYTRKFHVVCIVLYTKQIQARFQRMYICFFF